MHEAAIRMLIEESDCSRTNRALVEAGRNSHRPSVSFVRVYNLRIGVSWNSDQVTGLRDGEAFLLFSVITSRHLEGQIFAFGPPPEAQNPLWAVGRHLAHSEGVVVWKILNDPQ